MSSSPTPPPPVHLAFRPPPPEVQALLQRIPWCAKLLSASEDSNQQIRAFDSRNRVSKPGTTEDTLMSQTLATASTISTWQGFHIAPSPPSPSASASSSSSSSSSFSSSTSNGDRDGTGTFLFVIILGTGLNGHADTAHGGATATMLDELLGQVAYALREEADAAFFTATTTMDFVRPLRTPAVVLGRAWLDAARSSAGAGRKIWVEGVLEDGETGAVFARARSLFVRGRGRL